MSDILDLIKNEMECLEFISDAEKERKFIEDQIRYALGKDKVLVIE